MTPPTQPADGSARPGVGNHPLWYLLLAGLVVWQGWMTLSLFGYDHPWERLLDDQPIVSGRHPLHFYHGFLGAQSLLGHGTLCSYDPSFQAGYPKTPVFDSGSRPAELFLLLGGGTYRPAAYKLGLAVCCALVPLLLAAAARLAGLPRAGASLAALLGLLVWWGHPCRQALEAGQFDLLLATLAALLQISLLIRYDREPGLLVWLGLVASGNLGWFAHPSFFALLLPLALVYYLSVGHRHALVWHLALLVGLSVAVAINSFWLMDWLSYWWIRSPLHLEPRLLAHRTFHTLWDSVIWGDAADRALTVGLFLSGCVGVWRFNQSNQRPAARLLGLSAAGFLLLAIAGAVWEAPGSLGTPVLVVPGLLFAVLLAVHALLEGARLAARCLGCRWRGAGAAGCVLLTVGGLVHAHVGTFACRCAGTSPLVIGLSPEQLELAQTLRTQTSAAARILWEDHSGPAQAPHWTPLLPMLTERAFIGGLDPDACIEYAYANFTDQVLATRPLTDWTDKELDEYCQSYNIGWVVCWSPGAVKRFAAWKTATAVGPPNGQGPGCLFRLQRPLTFALRGQAQWLRADCQRIILGDVVPENGEVVLSLHYQAGMKASPQRVQIERDIDKQDPIPFVRLRVLEPVARITLTWEGGK
jgi:hypothetical protein